MECGAECAGARGGTDGARVVLRFRLNPWAFKAHQLQVGTLSFPNCRAWRLGPTNDEGWYMGQCRYSHLAPAWGEFYEIVGEDDLRDAPDDWSRMAGTGNRHFLFYFRDETFECIASDWQYR